MALMTKLGTPRTPSIGAGPLRLRWLFFRKGWGLAEVCEGASLWQRLSPSYSAFRDLSLACVAEGLVLSSYEP
eukprot:3711244-Amphidinium_carterae.1